MSNVQQSLNEIYKPLCDRNVVRSLIADSERFELACSELDGPFLIKSNSAFENSKRRVIIVGQENNGWIGPYGEFLSSKSLDDALNVYESFDPIQSYNSTFFQFLVTVAASLVPDYKSNPKQVIWSNLFKFNQGMNPQMIYSDFKEVALQLQRDIFSQEIEILKPNAVVFFTGPYYDEILKSFFPGIEQLPVENYPTRQLARLKHDKLPTDTFRTYHPGYLQRSLGKTGYCVPKIVEQIIGLKSNWLEQPNVSNDSQVTVDRIDMGTGWAVFQGGENPPPPNQLAGYLTDAFNNWLNNNPEFKVRVALPIVVNGNTVAINVWFE